MQETTSRSDLGTPRERRKRETVERIERNAVALALRSGSAAVTIEEICDLSNISVRTFYNYCDSKDAAIIGASPVLPSAEALDRFRAGMSEDILIDLLETVGESFASLDSPDPLSRDRARLLRAEPALLEAMGHQMVKVRKELADIVAERLRRCDPEGRTDRILVEAEMIVELKTAVMRTALFAWARSSSRTFDETRHDALAAAHRTIAPGMIARRAD